MWEDNSWLKIKRPDILAKRLAYHKFEGLDHLSEDGVFNRELHGYKKKRAIWRDLKDDVLDLYNEEHSFLEPIYNWWKEVPEIEPREIEIFMPLRDKHRDYDSGDFEDTAYDLTVDPLSPIRSNPRKMIETLGDMEEKGNKILDKIHINFLDPLFLPFPINPEEFVEYRRGEEKPIPKNLEIFYRRHSVSNQIFDSKKVVGNRIKLIGKKLEENMSLDDVEKNMYDSKEEKFDDEYKDEYRNYMNQCKGIIQRMCKLQMDAFMKSHNTGDNHVYLFGFKNDLPNILSGKVLENERFEKIIPTENRSGKTRSRVIRGGLQDDISLKSLKNRVENTYQEDFR